MPGKKDKEQHDPPEMTPTQLPVGTVHMVDPAGKFVLIQSSRFLPIEPETAITTVSSNGVETSQLKVSPARKGQFLTADIVSGRPGVGDRAVALHVPKVTDPAMAPFSPNAGGGGGDDEIQVLE